MGEAPKTIRSISELRAWLEFLFMKVDQQKDYLNIGLTASDKICLSAVIIGTILLNLTPVQQSLAVVPILILTAGIGLLRPVSGFYYIAMTQHFPAEMAYGFNPAQIGVLAWLLMTFPRLLFVKFKGWYFILLIIPLILWISFVRQEMIVSLAFPPGNYERIVIYSLMACQLANASKGEYLKCLLGLSLGSFAAGFSFWLNQIGLPVELSAWGDMRGGFERIGGTGTDAVMVWVGVLMGLAGILGISSALNLIKPGQKQTRNVSRLAWLALLIGIPPLIATVTTSAFFGLFLLMSFYFVVLLKTGQIMKQLKPIAIGMVLVSIVIATNQFQLLDRAKGFFNWYSETSEKNSPLGTREGVYSISIKAIASSPVFGIHLYEKKSQNAGLYDSRAGFLAHNVFLDYGINGGIPAMVYVFFLVFFPLIVMLYKYHFNLSLPFAFFYFIVFIFFMVLSFPFYKTFWALWMLTIVANINSRTV
jgi:O-antigen ligase